ncbi:MAG: hypothetical protein WD669_00225 [Pirellulales bacterium]
MNTGQSISFQWSAWSIVAGVIILASAALVCWMAWRRSGGSFGTGLLEVLRFTIITLVVITLMQPEWLTEYLPEETPTVVVLTDVSKSMQTRDVIDEADPGGKPQTRAEAIRPLVDEQLWQPLAERFRVVFESFSSALPEPTDGTDLNKALAESVRRHANLSAVVVGTDGDWNTGDSPARAASQLKMKNVPVFAVAAGSESRLPDLDLARVDAPTYGVLGKPLRIPFVVESSLPRDMVATVTLKPSSGEPVMAQVTIPANGQAADSLLWTPKQKGDYELTVSLPVDDSEAVAENNTRVVPIAIREEALRVLLIESFPRWEYRYIRNALERDPGVRVSCLLFHPGLGKVGGGKDYIRAFPKTLEELANFDVIFLGDVGVEAGQLTRENCRLIKAVVQSHASGLVWMPGMRGAHLSMVGTELDELYPVVLDPAQSRGWGSRVPAQMELTETGRRSLLTQLEDTEDANAHLWANFPGFQWYAAVLRARAGTEVLATHRTQTASGGRLPLLATKTLGTGKILFIGTDATWRWREGVEDKYHYRFWGQVIRWMAYQRSMAHGERMRLFFSPDRPQQGDTVSLYANVMATTGEPLRDGNVMVQVVAPSGKTESVRLVSQDEWGLFTGLFTPSESGTYQFTLTCKEIDATLETSLAVEHVRRERLGQPTRVDVLTEITTTTGGKLASTREIPSLLEKIAALPEPTPFVKRLRVWSHPVWAGLLVLLLGIFWTSRKIMGVI